MGQAKLIFIYNADAGLVNAALDTLHKWFSPQTYNCQLCRISHHGFGMRRAMEEFLQQLDMELVFLHRDDYQGRVGRPLELPVILLQGPTDPQAHVLLDRETINACEDLPQLLQALRAALPQAYSQNL